MSYFFLSCSLTELDVSWLSAVVSGLQPKMYLNWYHKNVLNFISVKKTTTESFRSQYHLPFCNWLLYDQTSQAWQYQGEIYNSLTVIFTPLPCVL